jgi:hypothetical protein
MCVASAQPLEQADSRRCLQKCPEPGMPANVNNRRPKLLERGAKRRSDAGAPHDIVNRSYVDLQRSAKTR